MKFQDIKALYTEKHLTKAELKKREEIAQAMEKEHPGMGSTPEGMITKMKLATVQAIKVAEEVEDLDEVSNYDLVVNYYRHLGLDPYKLRGAVGKQLRDKIKASPTFNAWARLNSSYEYGNHSKIIQELKLEKKALKDSDKDGSENGDIVKLKGGGEVEFMGGYLDANTRPSNTDKEQTKVATNFTTDR